MPSTRVENILTRGRKSKKLVDPLDMEEKLKAIREEFYSALVTSKPKDVPPPVVVNGKDGHIGPTGASGTDGRDVQR